jgi:hypothetical protein
MSCNFVSSWIHLFQTFRRSKQDPKSMHLCYSYRYSCVYSRECFSAFTGEYLTTGQPHTYTHICDIYLRYTLLLFPKPFHRTTYWHTSYLIIPWGRVLLEKLISYQLVKTFPTFYGIQMFIIAFTCTRHLSLSSARLIQSIPSITLLEDMS